MMIANDTARSLWHNFASRLGMCAAQANAAAAHEKRL